MPRRSKADAIDWDAIQRDWRLGTTTASQLAAQYGVAVSSITRKAKAEGWVQDKREEVEQTRESILIQAASGNANPNATPSAFQVKVAAQASADVVLEHRAGLARLKATKAALISQLEQAVEGLPDLLEIIEMIRQPNDNGVDRVNDAMRRAMERPQLIEDLKKLAEIDEKIRKGEREAWGIDRDADKGSTMEQMLAKLDAIAPPGSK